jgi:hypothetical protein
MQRTALTGIPYCPDFARITGSTPLALILAQALYHQIRAGSDWWARSGDEWSRETGFKRGEVYKYLERLQRKGYIEVKLKQVGNRELRFYRVSLKRVQDALNAMYPNRKPEHDLHGVRTFTPVRILYIPSLFRLVGNVKRALVLAQLCFYARARNTFALNLKVLKTATGFSTRYLNRALAYLEAKGLIGLCEHEGELLCAVRVQPAPVKRKRKRKPTTAVAPAKPTTTLPAPKPTTTAVARVELEQESPYSVVRTEQGLEVRYNGQLIGIARSHAEAFQLRVNHRNSIDPPALATPPPPRPRPRPQPQAEGFRSVGEILASVLGLQAG